MYYSTNYSSPIGEMLIVSDGEALCGVWFYTQKHFKSTVDEIVQNDDLAIFENVTKFLDDYFKGLNPKISFNKVVFPLPLAPTIAVVFFSGMVRQTSSST